jgi:oligopeptide/dipeptide ABC transporter ATP-binding protein
MNTPLLAAHDLSKHFRVRRPDKAGNKTAWLRAVDRVSFELWPGETLALVGESGCGKTTLARTAMLLLSPTTGRVQFDGQEMTGRPRRDLKSMRRRIQMVFQDPYGSLNPRLPVASIISEPLVIHRIGDRRQRQRRVADLIASVGLAESDLVRYPHQFSGGQRQRIAIARALAPEPDLIVADEPVSALDVSVQSQVLNLLKDLQDARRLTYLFISHDLGVVRQFADRVAVMYMGSIVETAPVETLFASPRHPYTRALIAAVPVIGRGKRTVGTAPMGEVPSLLDPPAGCPYHPRCPLAMDTCRKVAPVLDPIADGHAVACHADREG